MLQNRPEMIVVCGPTATGKTSFAVRLARELNGEIVNADSMQVYRHMDVGTAKPTVAERRLARFHLVDVVDPDDTFSTGRFKEIAEKAVTGILERGKIPIVAGGTGLYIKALTRGLFSGPSADPALRARYKQKEAEKPGILFHRLQQVDPARAGEVNPADFVRIERSLEVYDLTGKPISQWQDEHRFGEQAYHVLSIGLDRPPKELASACNDRVLRMMKNGWLAEVRKLRESGYGPELPSQAAIGYKELHQFLDGRYSLSDAVERIQASTRRFAKRQRTWFGADQSIRWFHAQKQLSEAAEAAVRFAPG